MVITTINIKEKGCDNQGQKLGCLEDSWSQTNKTLILNIFPIPQGKADTLFLLLLLLLFVILFFFGSWDEIPSEGGKVCVSDIFVN